jgi:hypothetical protein
MADEAREERRTEGDERERPRLKEIDHEAPDGVSADAVFDRGTAERDERERSGAGRRPDDAEADR